LGDQKQQLGTAEYDLLTQYLPGATRQKSQDPHTEQAGSSSKAKICSA
jgi:hypothetical protein